MYEVDLFGHNVKIGTACSSHNPEQKGGVRTSDVRAWLCFDGDWFQPNINSAFKLKTQLMELETEDALEHWISLVKR